MVMEVADHPAKFSAAVLEVMAEFIPPEGRVLDPFAGVGGIYAIAPQAVGVEIEPEWARADRRTIVADALALPFGDERFDCVATSPCYGNRMADSHNAQERCRACGGSGRDPDALPLECPKCHGAGRRAYRRITYRHSLGRPLHPSNSGQMQWGQRYRDFHRAAWTEAVRVLRGGGSFVLNVSNHIRAGEEQPVVSWHLGCLRTLGLQVRTLLAVPTPRMRYGANGHARMAHEYVVVFRAP